MATQRDQDARKAKLTATESETVQETASEEEGATSSSDDFEIRLVVRSANNNSRREPATVEDEEDTSASASVSDGDDDAKEEAVVDRPVNQCAYCTSKKAKSCHNSACKKCCVRFGSACVLHSKLSEVKVKESPAMQAETAPLPLRKTRKAVLKNEFKESNIMYYDETVVQFCARDFFHAKKISQPLLNDQTRALRVTGASTKFPKAKKRRVANPELRARIMDGFVSDPKRRKVDAAQVAH